MATEKAFCVKQIDDKSFGLASVGFINGIQPFDVLFLNNEVR